MGVTFNQSFSHLWTKLSSWQRPDLNKATKSILRPGQGVGGGQVIWMWVWLNSPTQVSQLRWVGDPNHQSKDREWVIGCTDSFADKHGYCPATYMKINHNLKKHARMCLRPGHTKCKSVSHFNTFLFHFYTYLSLSSLVMHWKQQLICCWVWITDFTLERLMQRRFKWKWSSRTVGLLHSSESTWWNSNILWTAADSRPSKRLVLGLCAIIGHFSLK